MTREEAIGALVAAIGGPQTLHVDRETWVAAAALGGLRQAANDSIRSPHRSRGDDKNAAGDLQGSFGELLVASTIEQRLPYATIAFAPLNWNSPGDDVDATVTIEDHTLLVEAKCHLHEPNKRLFLINAVAAERSRARGARSFVPVISAVGSAVALLGRPLLMADVSKWPSREFGYGDPARAANLQTFVPEYFHRSFAQAIAEVEEEIAVDRQTLAAAAASAHDRFETLRESGVMVDRTPLAAIKTLVAVV